MPTFRVTAPDGRKFEVTAPDGATQEQVLEYAKTQFAKQEPMKIEQPAAVKAGEAIGGIPRQLGLTARYVLEGLAQAAQIGTEPLRWLTDKLGGQGKSRPLSDLASGLADTIGLPKPGGANERVIGDATRLLAGAGGLGAAGRVAQTAGGAVKPLGDLFANNLGQQLTGAAGAGLAGGSVREAGGGEVPQAVASLLGGVTGPLAIGAAQSAGRSAVNAGRRLLDEIAPRSTPGATQAIDQRIELTLRGQGIDWNAIPERIKQPMRAEVQAAMRTGNDLSPDALRRLLDFRTVGATPTRGMLTQDPVQITREKNLAKVGANSLDVGLQRLPGLENQNTAQLLSTLDNLGARGAPDAFATGERVVGALTGNVNRARSVISDLYSQARDTQGRSAPLNGAQFTTAANQALDEALLGYAVPSSVQTKLNQIANGEVPFTVDFAEQLKTVLGDIARADKGGATSKAMGIIRRALDDTTIQPTQINQGNLPAVAGTVPQSETTLGQEAIQAFNRARQANRGLMSRVEQSPALQAVYDGIKSGQPADPDRFVQQFIVGQGASLADVRNLQRAVSSDPQAMQSVKQYLVSHLKSAATNGTEDVTKFSPAAYNRALNNIGDRKLSLFFSEDEIRQIRAVGRVGTLMTSQPAGSAVNNSNSGAMLVAKGMDILDAIAGRLPLGLDTTITGLLRGVQQGQALNVPRSLVEPGPSVGLLSRMGAPAVYGGLLLSQPVD